MRVWTHSRYLTYCPKVGVTVGQVVGQVWTITIGMAQQNYPHKKQKH